ncbi:MAG: sugar phosphate isomerase/epimerase family protein [Promethearchaeota archaeon]
MELGISSLAYINECRTFGKYNSSIDILIDGSQKTFEFAEKNDIKICELLIDPPAIDTNEKCQRFIELCDNYKSVRKQIHGPYSDVNLASHNHWIRKASIECYTEIAKLCKKIGAKVYTIHPGSARYLHGYNKEINTSYLLQSVRELLDNVSEIKLTNCIENMQNKTGILLDLQECENFFNNIERDDIFFTWDTSHSWTCNVKVPELWKSIHSYIKNIHIVDNIVKTSDVHPALGVGKIDFKEIFDIANSYKYKGSMIIEIGYGKDMEPSVDFIRKFF